MTRQQQGTTAPPGKEAARRRLAEAHKAIKEAEKAEVRAVAVARVLEVSWAKIGEQVGQKQPNATRKYRPLVEQLIADERGVQVGTTTPDEALAAIRKAHEAIEEAEWKEVEAVADARGADLTWGEIAEIVEMNQPNAVRKYRPYLQVSTEVKVTAVRPDPAEQRRRRSRGL